MAPTDDRSMEKLPESLLVELDKPRPPFKDESLAPAVERALLWRLVRGELSDAEAEGAYRLVYSFRSWDEAHTEILVQHYHETKHDASEK